MVTLLNQIPERSEAHPVWSKADEAANELEETRKLVRSLNRFLHNYRQIHAGSAFLPMVEKAAARVEESLTDCMRKATDELVLPPPLV